MKQSSSSSITSIEVDVHRIRNGDEHDLLQESVQNEAHSSGQHLVIYTSRVELTFGDVDERLHFGEKVSSFLMKVVRNLPTTLGFLISKRGITATMS